MKEEKEEVMHIKEEPEDEQELMVNLLDCQTRQPHLLGARVHLASRNKPKASVLNLLITGSGKQLNLDSRLSEIKVATVQKCAQPECN